MSVRRLFDMARGHSRPEGHELIPVVAEQPVSSSYPQHATFAEPKEGNFTRSIGAGVIGDLATKFELVETERGYAYQLLIRPDPEVSVGGHGQCYRPWCSERVEIFSVEPSHGTAVNDQPKKTILRLPDLTCDRAGQALLIGEMGTQKAARRLVWVNRADRSA